MVIKYILMVYYYYSLGQLVARVQDTRLIFQALSTVIGTKSLQAYCDVVSLLYWNECYKYRMLQVQNAINTECYKYRMLQVQNVTSTECNKYRMLQVQNVTSTEC